MESENSDNNEEEYFSPDKFIRMVNQFFTDKVGWKFGLFMGILYANITYFFAIAIWLGIGFALTFTDFFTSGINLALISITIGSFVIMTGSSLVNHFDEENLNFKAYVHNSVTFIASGIALLGGYIFRIVVNNWQIPPIFDFGITAIIFSLNFVGGFLLMISLWVILKLLWRLNQLTMWKKEYEHTASIYSEFRASIAGAKLGVETGKQAHESKTEPGVLRQMIGSGIIIAIMTIPYLQTGEIIWSVALYISLIVIGLFSVVFLEYTPQRSTFQRVMSYILAIIFIAAPYYLEKNVFLSAVVLGVVLFSNGIRIMSNR